MNSVVFHVISVQKWFQVALLRARVSEAKVRVTSKSKRQLHHPLVKE